ncbi:TON1 Recruiting Motif 9 [Hibiscus trionum]|uniref:TON1 Recruiting Motif 9 n=1 Tax=Hibiscus trionum TaxID=183268 RepID=A0A9W7MD14_HIBTR|nr:TON1 Recruiting Motif 9 [Hibiscus trionum]
MAASSTNSCSNFNPNSTKGKHNSPLERRPRMLKDFLHDDSSSCSSNGFKSFPRKSSRENLNNGQRLERSRSKAASTTISAFQAMINAIKSIHFASSVKSPSILLPRSLSRKLSRRNSQSQLNVGSKITVTVKDIIRWKSFRDLVEEKSRPSDFAPSSPHHCTTATTTTTTTGSNTPCSSNGSSWCDSDFTSEYSPSDEYGENEVGKKLSPCVGKDPMETKTTTKTAGTDMGPRYANEEAEQHSPVSVLGGGEAKAWQLVNRVKETIPLTRCESDTCVAKLLLDLFREEVEYCETVKLVKAWIDGERSETTKREACVREMEREGRWRNCRFQEEQQELAMGVERWVVNILVDELLVDLLRQEK